MTVSLRDLRTVRYVVTARGAELVSDRTAQRHRLLIVDDEGNATIRVSDGGRILATMSGAEVRLVAREYHRAMRRRALERLLRR